MVLFLLFYCMVLVSVALCENERGLEDDIFPPFGHVNGPRRSHRHVRECQPAKYNNVTSELFPAQNVSVDSLPDAMEVRFFSKEFSSTGIYEKRMVFGHHVIANNPALTVSILEPHSEGGCKMNIRETVTASATQKHCLFAVNAGFFNVTDGACLGNVVSDGREVFNSGGIQNAHFGIKRDGSLFFGYIPEDESLNDTFEQLVGGVIWLVRNGENYIDTSKVAECPDAQSTSTLQGFIDVLSARTAIGHDRYGRVHIVQVDGKTHQRGLTMYEFADLLRSFGIVNAINLDGGGSATAVLNGSVVNYPSDTRKLDDFAYNVARNVSTIVCVSDYPCLPDSSCNGHGECVHGSCRCDANWHGRSCHLLLCPAVNCSGHGNCFPDGCKCHPGWWGENCSISCPQGTYGYECQSTCRCPGNTTTCHAITGKCSCAPGYTGHFCESSCPPGRYGESCGGVCRCSDGCFCDPVDGSCDNVSPNAQWKVGQCYGNMVVSSKSMDMIAPRELRSWLFALVSLSVVACLSLILNFYFLYKCCETGSSLKSRNRIRHLPRLTALTDDEDESDEIPLMNLDAKDSVLISKSSLNER